MPTPETAAALEQSAQERYLATDYRGAIETHERAYAAYRDEGDALGAGRAARMLAWMHGNMFGDWAVRNGWLGRARSLLAEAGQDSAEHGWVLLFDAEGETDRGARLALYEEAHRMGRAHDDPDLEFEALGWVGLQRAIMGRVEEGLELLDESLAAVVAGDTEDLYVLEALFCGLFWACERFHDVARAEQWIRAAADVMEKRNLVAVGGYCRAHYGGILTAAGRWGEAEVELVEAARLFDRGYAAMKETVLIRLADLRVRQGRLEEADQLLEGLDHHADAVRPLAALRLARGETAVARDLLERRLSGDALDPDIAAPLLALLVDVHLAAETVEEAAAASDRLSALAAGRPEAHYLRAAAALARGQVCVARHEGDAVACMRDALSAFADAQMPVELARTRLELARTLAEERPEVAVAEAKSALAAFERLEAARDADTAAALLRDLGGPARTGPKRREPLTKREGEVLDLIGHGLSNADIADRLYISPKTVEHHVSRVLMKLGVKNRAEAAAQAARGAASAPPPDSGAK